MAKMMTLEDYDKKIEQYRSALADAEAKKREFAKKLQERDRKWESAVTQAAGAILLAATGCEWQELDLTSLESYLAGQADELRPLVTLPYSSPEDAKARLDARSPKPKRRKGTKQATTSDEDAAREHPVAEGDSQQATGTSW